MKKLGLTGSIGMGKSTVASLFATLGAAIWDADKAVHELYGKNGAAVEPIRSLFPEVVMDGAVMRDRLSALILEDHTVLEQIEQIVHPMVLARQHEMTTEWKTRDMDLTVFDIPLLFEHNRHGAFDATAVVIANEQTRRARVLARPGMTVEKYRKIVARQMPDREKMRKATYIIRTDCSLEETACMVEKIYTTLLNRPKPAKNETAGRG